MGNHQAIQMVKIAAPGSKVGAKPQGVSSGEGDVGASN